MSVVKLNQSAIYAQFVTGGLTSDTGVMVGDIEKNLNGKLIANYMWIIGKLKRPIDLDGWRG